MDNACFILELQSTPEEVMRAVERLQQFCREQGVAEKAIHALMLSLEEMASNVVNHAYQRDPSQCFRVSVQNRGDRIVVE
ncbi:MAG: ATP-binding protein, partial [Verrucomicrobiota bacterium]